MRRCSVCKRAVLPTSGQSTVCAVCHTRFKRYAGAAEQRHAYYTVLHQDASFDRELRELFERVYPESRKRMSRRQRRAAIHRSDARGTAKEEPAIVAFATRWHLSQLYGFELDWALDQARWGEPPRPQLRAFHGHIPLLPPIRLRVDLIEHFFPFFYNPALDPVAEADRILAPLRVDLIDQMRDQHQAHLVPARLRNRVATLRLARRLYRAAVLDPKEWTWQRIAEAERAGGHQCTWRAVRDSVRAWARALGVALPSRPPGRR